MIFGNDLKDRSTYTRSIISWSITIAHVQFSRIRLKIAFPLFLKLETLGARESRLWIYIVCCEKSLFNLFILLYFWFANLYLNVFLPILLVVYYVRTYYADTMITSAAQSLRDIAVMYCTDIEDVPHFESRYEIRSNCPVPVFLYFFIDKQLIFYNGDFVITPKFYWFWEDVDGFIALANLVY